MTAPVEGGQKWVNSVAKGQRHLDDALRGVKYLAEDASLSDDMRRLYMQIGAHLNATKIELKKLHTLGKESKDGRRVNLLKVSQALATLSSLITQIEGVLEEYEQIPAAALIIPMRAIRQVTQEIIDATYLHDEVSLS